MLVEPPYTKRQYWLSIVIAGLISALSSSAVYLILYFFFYVQQSYLFSIIYLIPLLASTITLSFFKYRFAVNKFSYRAAFMMSFFIGIVSALLFSGVLYMAYSSGLESRIELFSNIDNHIIQQLMSPSIISLSMLSINIILSLLFSFIIAIFAKRKT